MKKIILRSLSLIFVLCMIFTVTSCKKEKEDTENDTTVATVAPEGEFVYTEVAPKRDYDGATFRILCTIQTQQFFDESSHIDAVKSAVMTRNRKVSEQFDINLEYTAIDGNGSNEVGFSETVRNTCLAGLGEECFDLVLPQSYYGVALGIEGLYYNFNDSEYLMKDKEWYYQSINENCGIEGQTYFLATTFLMDKTTAAEVVYYNVDLGDSFGIDEEEVYDLVIGGKWTVDKLKTYAEYANGSEDILGVVSSAHGVRGMMIGCKTPFVEKNNDGALAVTYYNEHLIEVFDKVFNFFNGNEYIKAEALDANLPMFPKGKAVFALTYVHSMLETNNIDSEVDYTVLPMPKFNEEQAEYITDVQRWELVSVPISVDAERACIILDALSYYNYDELLPVYWESLLGTRFARNEKASQIVEIIRNSIYYDFTAIFQMETKKIYVGSTGYPNVATLIMNNEYELASWWGSYGSALPELIDLLNLKYQELAEFKASH